MSIAWRHTSNALLTERGWEYVPCVILSPRQVQVMKAIARQAVEGRLQWGALQSIANATGIPRKQLWNLTLTLRKKFGVHNRHQLIPIAKQLSKNVGGRGRYSNRASTTAGVHAIGASTNNPAREALHPGTAPSRAL